jgi:methionyl-tRNA synthetase
MRTPADLRIELPSPLRHTAARMSKQFYITTAIDYVNGAPHLGHAYEKVITDVMARGRRSLGEPSFFLTGLDEHGQKVQQAAHAEGKDPQAYVDELATTWKAFADLLELSNDDFVRTSEPRHKRVVEALLTKLHDQGDIYKAEYRGWYSWRQETFLTDKDRRPDGTWDPLYGEVKELIEHNWYFKMGQHQQWLIDHIDAHPEFVYPDYRRNEVLGFLRKEQLEDLCISRPKERLNWGIPMPFDPEYVNYVWFDALTNYITVPASLGDPAILEALPSLKAFALDASAAQSVWPADVHVIGKDILKFHAVYWPIMLHAAGMPLPRQIVAHGWWQREGAKIAKTTGNIVDPAAVIADWGLDAFRFYVLRELDIGPDGNWTDAGFAARYAAELANGLGNLVNRSLSMLTRYREGVVPAPSGELAEDAAAALESVRSQLTQHKLQGGLQSIWSLITRTNQYVDQTAPFKLAKQPDQAARLDEVLYNLAETCRIIAVLLWPFLPTTACRIYGQLGLDEDPDQMSRATWGGLKAGHRIRKPEALFPRRESTQ